MFTSFLQFQRKQAPIVKQWGKGTGRNAETLEGCLGGQFLEKWFLWLSWESSQERHWLEACPLAKCSRLLVWSCMSLLTFWQDRGALTKLLKVLLMILLLVSWLLFLLQCCLPGCFVKSMCRCLSLYFLDPWPVCHARLPDFLQVVLRFYLSCSVAFPISLMFVHGNLVVLVWFLSYYCKLSVSSHIVHFWWPGLSISWRCSQEGTGHT